MKALFDRVSIRCSKMVTRTYSTSFSLGIRLLGKKMHGPIYAIYGFVRFADEIVDSFHGYPKEALLADFRAQTYAAIRNRISLNPILNSFQQVVNQYDIELCLVDAFMDSMQMDLRQQVYSQSLYEKYILGSAEVVGLMCLRVFCEGNHHLYDTLKAPAMKLGAAFQKVNFLRDIKADTHELGRLYFPGVDLERFSCADKRKIEQDIEADFDQALAGIKKLPQTARKGVYLAYAYYRVLFNKIKRLPPSGIMSARIRVANGQKLGIMLQTMMMPNI